MGVPVHDDRLLFGAHYQKLFANFEATKIVKSTDKKLEKFLLDSGIIRNRLKVFRVRKNAEIFIEIQKEFGSFDKYRWIVLGIKRFRNARIFDGYDFFFWPALNLIDGTASIISEKVVSPLSVAMSGTGLGRFM